MCEQCNTDCVTFGEVVPGLFFIQAKKAGRLMRAGDYGLVRCNDPDLIWSFRPEPDPYEGMSDEEINQQDGVAWAAWRDKAKAFALECKVQLGMNLAFRFGLLCQAGGYDIEKDGRLDWWLFHRVGLLLQAGKAP